MALILVILKLRNKNNKANLFKKIYIKKVVGNYWIIENLSIIPNHRFGSMSKPYLQLLSS